MMGTEMNPLSKEDEEEYQEDLFIKLPPERVPVKFHFQVSDDPNDLPPPPLTPADYNIKESENG